MTFNMNYCEIMMIWKNIQCITFNSNEGINGDGSLEICSKSASPNDFIVNTYATHIINIIICYTHQWYFYNTLNNFNTMDKNICYTDAHQYKNSTTQSISKPQIIQVKEADAIKEIVHAFTSQTWRYLTLFVQIIDICALLSYHQYPNT
eukprot:445344_1